MGMLLERVASEQRLLEAWSEIRRRADTDANHSRALTRFAADPASRITRLSGQLLAGTWQPGALSPVELPKASGGIRRLGVPSIADRIVERTILGVIDPLVDPELLPWSFAYRRGLGVADALSALVEARDDGMAAVVRLDITDCFDHVARAHVLRRLRPLIDDGGLVQVLQRILYRTGPKGGRARARGVPQGAPLSPLFANVFLDSFDRSMLDAGHRVIRYADDIAIPITDEAEGAHVLALATEILASMGLTCGASKSGVVGFETGVPFCGELLSDSTQRHPKRIDRPVATSVYVATNGALLRTRNARLVVEAPGADPWRISLDRVRQIVVFGRVGITTPLLHRLLERDIDVVLLSDHGRYFGRIAGSTGADPFIREAQYRCATTPADAMVLARAFVSGKLTNQRTVLLRSPARHHRTVVTALGNLDDARTRCMATSGINELMGVEGAAARAYFGALGVVLEGSGFSTRKRRPPPDPVNSALSFGYTLLVQEVQGATEVAGLDPYRGFLHQPRVGRPSLALDLVEEWRPVLVDWLLVSLFTSGRLTAEDFEVVPSGGSDLCRLTAAGRRKFLAAYEHRLLTMFTHSGSGRRVSYRVGLSLQASALGRALRAELGSYRPVAWK